MANLISTTGPICPNVADTPLDNRSRVSTIANIGNIPLAWKGMLVYCEENGNTYKITSLKPKTSGPVVIENYYPATWVEFGSGGSTPSPTPSAIDAGNVTYTSGDTFSNGTVGKELQSLASDIGSKVSGIQVTGEDNVRYPVNGIVTIPAGGGGTGTITGATVGGNPVTASGGILQFDAYPTVPITSIETSDHTPLAPNNGLVTLPAIPAAPTADTMQYSGSTNYSTGSIGKEVKDLNGSITNLSTKVAELESDKPSPTPSSSITTVNLASYTTSGSSFTYDVDNKYIYNTKDTTFYQYSEEDNATTVYYGVFKVIGEDEYLRYSITNNTTFTYENTYTELTLPENAKKEFALGSVAVVKRVNGEGESWKNGTVNLFCTKQNMPLRNRCKNINFNGSTAWRVLIKSEDGNTIFVYKAKPNGNYEWEINVPRSSTANFNLLDKYFDRPDASNVSFDDSITRLGTQEDPVTDVQAAINMLATAIASGQCIFSVTVKDYNAVPLADKELTVSYSLNGTTTPLSNIVTDSSGNCIFVIPYGATYSITYPNVTDRLKPNTSTGIATNAHMLIQVAYELQADNEELFIGVQLRNASMLQYNVEGKKVYIYYKESGNWHVTPDITITLAADGTIATGGVEYKDIATPSDTCIIPRNTNYKVSLQEWNPESPADEQDFIKSEDMAFTATEFTRQYIGYYYYKKAGIFLAIEDYEGNTDLNTWTEYRCKDVDTTNWIATIHDDSDNKDYKIKYDSTYGLMKLDLSDTSGTWEQWYSITNLNRVLGVGVRTSNLVNTAIGNVDYSAHGFETSCFLIPYNVDLQTSAMQNSTSAWTGLSRGISGKYTTDEMLGSSDPFSDMAILINSITKKIGSYTQNAFIGSGEQLSAIRANRDAIVTLLKCVNNSALYSTGSLILTSCTETGSDARTGFIRVAISGTVPSTPLAKNSNTHTTIPLFAI